MTGFRILALPYPLFALLVAVGRVRQAVHARGALLPGAVPDGIVRFFQRRVFLEVENVVAVARHAPEGTPRRDVMMQTEP